MNAKYKEKRRDFLIFVSLTLFNIFSFYMLYNHSEVHESWAYFILGFVFLTGIFTFIAYNDFENYRRKWATSEKAR